MKKIGILGAGSWGVTLGILLAEKKHDVTLWEFDENRAKALCKKRKLDFLPHINIPSSVKITSRINLVKPSQLLVFAIPSHTVRVVAKQISSLNFPEDMIILSVAKGLEQGTCLRMFQVISEELPKKFAKNICVLSGPSHAEEVSKKMPTSVVVASKDEKIALEIQKIFMSSYFRVYTSDDICGVEAGGALKNIIAIAAGISDGLGMGDNAKASLITRGLREIIRFGMKLGGKFSTFSGLSGIGDLVVTCTSKGSPLFGVLTNSQEGTILKSKHAD